MALSQKATDKPPALWFNLTPSLSQLVKYPGWKMHGRACKQSIFRSYNTSIFSAMRLDEDPFTCQRKKKEDKNADGFQISHFYGSFSNDIMAVKGLDTVGRTWLACTGVVAVWLTPCTVYIQRPRFHSWTWQGQRHTHTHTHTHTGGFFKYTHIWKDIFFFLGLNIIW